MPRRAIFGPEERRVVRRSIEEAEDLTSRFYCIPGREWPRFPYELATLADGPGPAAPAFADLVRLVAPRGAPGPGGIRELFRIRLRDDAILGAVRDRQDDLELAPLLLYVLTHELVHVVRFGSKAARFDAAARERRREERLVHWITREVLRPAEDAALRRVLAVYREAPAGEGLPDCASPK